MCLSNNTGELSCDIRYQYLKSLKTHKTDCVVPCGMVQVFIEMWIYLFALFTVATKSAEFFCNEPYQCINTSYSFDEFTTVNVQLNGYRSFYGRFASISKDGCAIIDCNGAQSCIKALLSTTCEISASGDGSNSKSNDNVATLIFSNTTVSCYAKNSCHSSHLVATSKIRCFAPHR